MLPRRPWRAFFAVTAVTAVTAGTLSVPFASPVWAEEGGDGNGASVRLDSADRFTPDRQFTVSLAGWSTTQADTVVGLSLTLPERLVPQSVYAPGLGCDIRPADPTSPDGAASAEVDCSAGSTTATVTMRVTVTVDPGATTVDTVRATYTVNGGQAAESAVDVLIAGTLPSATVSGRVWNDVDHDGRQDTGEPGVPGVGVISGFAHADTGPDGRYTLRDVELGTVSVEFVVPRRYLFSPPGTEDERRDSDVESGEGCGEECAFGFTTCTLTEPTAVDAGVFDPLVLPASRALPAGAPVPPPIQPVAQTRASLASTGVPISTLAAFGCILLAAGIGLIAYSRHRPSE